MQTVSLIGVLALAVALGSVLLGYGLLLPGLEGAELIDANLAHALAHPLYLRTGEVVLVAGVVLVAVMPKWTANPRATPLALVVAALAGIHRLVVLPALGEAWSRVDAVAQRPLPAMEEAERWADYHVLVSVLLLALLLGLTGLTIRRGSPTSAA